MTVTKQDIDNAAQKIVDSIEVLNDNFVATQKNLFHSDSSKATMGHVRNALSNVQHEIENLLEEKTGWGRNEIKQLVAQALHNAEIKAMADVKHE